MNITITQAISNSSDFIPYNKCKDLCSLKCDSTNFDKSGTEIVLTEEDFSFQFNYLNSSFNYTKGRTLVLKVQYNEMKYTKMSQTKK